MNKDPFLAWEELVVSTKWWPGSHLTVAEVLPGYIELRVQLYTKDSYRPDVDVKIGHKHRLPDHLVPAGVEAMSNHLKKCLRQVAIHESDEWINIDGKHPFDPHKEAASR